VKEALEEPLSLVTDTATLTVTVSATQIKGHESGEVHKYDQWAQARAQLPRKSGRKSGRQKFPKNESSS
jgi:hypothetical protein